MVRKPKDIPSQFKNLGEWVESLAKDGKKPKELVALTNCSKSFAYKIAGKVRSQTAEEKAEIEGSEVEIEAIEREEKVDKFEEAKRKREEFVKKASEQLTPVIDEIVTTGQVTVRTASMIFSAVNYPLKKFYPQYAMSDEECIDLGAMWRPVLNRKFKEAIEAGEDLDLYLAIFITALIIGSRYAMVVYDKVKGGKTE